MRYVTAQSRSHGKWKNESSEDAEAKSFWDAFFNVFGITRRRVASFEKPVVKSDGKGGFIDLLWKGVLLVEHKSLGRDLIVPSIRPQTTSMG
ncbi:MAG: type IIL restriction-modification enzyme MmeI [Terracidiphilus sp.]